MKLSPPRFKRFLPTRSPAPACQNWKFHLGDVAEANHIDFDDSAWTPVALPHTAHIEPPVIRAGGPDSTQWQGICWYRKSFRLPSLDGNHFALLKFQGAMNVADVWINGRHVTTHLGGFLPFCIELTGPENLIAVRLDNTDNPITGPRPLDQLDFNTYGGIYRPVDLILKNKLHITDPVHADKTAGGGLFISCPQVTPDSAVLNIKVHIRNRHDTRQEFTLRYELTAPQQTRVIASRLKILSLSPNSDITDTETIAINTPELWDIENPSLHTVTCRIEQNGEIIDTHSERIGIRRIEITPDGFFLNGKKRFLRGVNRHQEYPCIGYAVSDNAQYRDAKTIKDAGFDYIRLSHYPQSPAFMDACDELGLVVMNCIPGWQYFNPDPAFAEYQYKSCRELIRRDRNHPCAILWEVSLNETGMPKAFMEKTRSIAKEEMPDECIYTCGWEGDYDVFIQARQHGGCKGVNNRPCVVSEYGDWEYYACNDGLDQLSFSNLQQPDLNSRQGRGDGEIRMIQQALNFQEAHNDNLKTKAFADGLWVMYDYNRGYAADLEKSGCMDIYRLPKFSTFFFRSQRDPVIIRNEIESGPMVFIANYHTPESPETILVFSNAEEVALFQNGKLVGRQRPDSDNRSSHLPHPPFSFKLTGYEPGTLEAVAYINNREAARHKRTTPGNPVRLILNADFKGRPIKPGTNDCVFIYASIVDQNGTVVPSSSIPVTFAVKGPARLIGDNPAPAEAGISPVLLQAGDKAGRIHIYATAPDLEPAGLVVKI